MATITLDRPAPMNVPEESEQPPQQRLSEALRRGAGLHPQGYNALYRNGKTCALGAILVGLMGPEFVECGTIIHCGHLETVIQRHTGVDLDQCVPLPQPCRGSTTLARAMVHLNDRAEWSREAIADWLQSLGF